MREQEIRMLRCIGDIDNELILEADTARFRSRKWANLAALAACLALVVSIPFLLPKTSEKAPLPGPELLADEDNKHKNNAMADQTESAAQESAPDSSDITLGGLAPGMTEDAVRTLLGEPDKVTEEDNTSLYRWLYNDLTVCFSRFSHEVWEIRAFPGSGLSLSNGIGFDSTTEQVDSTLSHALIADGSLDTDKYDTLYSLNLPYGFLNVELANGTVSAIEFGDGGNPLLDALDVTPITIHTLGEKELWTSVTAIDKSAKRLCVTLSISEPDVLEEKPEAEPSIWLEFTTGAVVGLHGQDYAVVYACDGDFVPGSYDNLTAQLEGVFGGIDDAVTQALANPTETWK